MSSVRECYYRTEIAEGPYLKLIKCNRQSLVISVYLSHVDCVAHHAKEHVRGDLFLEKHTHRVKVPASNFNKH
jgi:hypothetical protein